MWWRRGRHWHWHPTPTLRSCMDGSSDSFASLAEQLKSTFLVKVGRPEFTMLKRNGGKERKCTPRHGSYTNVTGGKEKIFLPGQYQVADTYSCSHHMQTADVCSTTTTTTTAGTLPSSIINSRDCPSPATVCTPAFLASYFNRTLLTSAVRPCHWKIHVS